LTVPWVLYVVSVGGDFLDLYRFFVPVLPLAALALAAAWHRAFVAARARRGRYAGLALAAIAALALLAYGAGQRDLRARALEVSEPGRAARGIEPLGWTRSYALRWAAMGRFIGGLARPGDWMAVGAAGAMPFYAGIDNLDTLGLCDAWVAHHAPVVGDRPGHQRFAPLPYILARRPVFLLIGNDYTSDRPLPLRRDPVWRARGYVWARAHVTTALGAPEPFFHYFLLRRDRAAAWRGRPGLAVAGD
ncbi:MAG: hypothetical protein KC543_11540, partial [Myxococcales bacterium]|nr:hypothetical protein [Myxococcales bacterium]